MIPTISGTGLLSIPAIATKLALHDMWITPILGSIPGFVTVYIVWKTFQLFPNLTPYEYSEKILGKILGKFFCLLLVIFYLHNTGLVIRQYSDFITSNVMQKSPLLAFSFSILLISAIAVRGGIEVIARSSIICTAIYLSSLLVIIFLINKIDVGQLLPFLENGPIPLIKGSLIHASWFTEFYLLAFLLPFLNNKENGLKAGIRATFFLTILLFYVSFFVLTLFGITSINQLYPVYTMFRNLSLFGFFENFEVLITASWVLGNFVKVSVFLFVTCIGIGHLFGIKDQRVLVFPVSLLILLFSYWNIPNIVYLLDYMVYVQPFYFLIIQTALPLLLLIVGILRYKRSG